MAFSLDRLAVALRERRPLAWLTGAVVWLSWLGSLAAGGWTHDATGHRLGADHVQYYVIGQLVNEGRAADLYDVPTLWERQKEVAGPGWRGPLPFRYPPLYALVFAPTSRLPYEASLAVWTLLSVAALAATVWCLEGRDAPAALGQALCFYPVFAAFGYGQNSLINLAILAFALALLRRRRLFPAGLVAGVLLYKPQLLAGVGLLWLLQARRLWPALLGMALTGAVLAGLSWWLIPDGVTAFWESARANALLANPGWLHSLYSSQGFWMLLLPGHEMVAHQLSVASSLVAAAALAVLWWRSRADDEVLFAAAVGLTPLISPYVFVYDWSLLLLPAFTLPRRLPAERSRWVVVSALVWVAALVSKPLVELQERLSPVAVQVSVPALVVACVLAWPALAPRSGPTPAPQVG